MGKHEASSAAAPKTSGRKGSPKHAAPVDESKKLPINLPALKMPDLKLPESIKKMELPKLKLPNIKDLPNPKLPSFRRLRDEEYEGDDDFDFD